MAKKQVTVNLDEEILDWIEEKIKDKKFATRSHGMEYAIMHLIREEKLEEQGNDEAPCPVLA
ncbi:MAG: ribbon-helix-helix domain-containing protein [Dehalococcoidia bacterium]